MSGFGGGGMMRQLGMSQPQGAMDALAGLRPYYDALAEQPDTEYRSQVLPFRRTTGGETKLALPQAAVDFGKGALDLLAGTRTGEVTPQATMALASLGGLGTAPKGALGALAGRRSATFPTEAAAALEQRLAQGGLSAAEQQASLRDSGLTMGLHGQLQQPLPMQALRTKSLAEAPMQDFRSSHTLGDIYENGDDLFNAYPHLRDLEVGYAEDPGVEGVYRPSMNRIEIARDIDADPSRREGVLRHEVQHAIQRYEGTPGGTSPEVAAQSPGVQGGMMARLFGGQNKRAVDAYMSEIGEQEARAAARMGANSPNAIYDRYIDRPLDNMGAGLVPATRVLPDWAKATLARGGA